MTRNERRKRALVRLERELKWWEARRQDWIEHCEPYETNVCLAKIKRKKEAIANTKKNLGYE